MTTRRAVRTRQARPTGRAVPGGPAAAAGAVLVLALAACSPGGSDDSPSPSSTATSASPSPTGSPSTTPEPGAEPTDGASTPSDDATEAPLPFPANTDPDTQDPSADAALTVTDVRVGHHDGFDRVVLELGGTGTPGWRVEYVDQPTDDGKGDVVAVDGDAYLQVMISGSGYPMDTGVEEYAGPNPVRAGDDGEVEEVLLRGVFEGYTQAFVGVDDERRPFRVFSLEDPTRVVVDVRDDG
ncbi:AMIN-like domain-containing (lipo)protein [Cellulosimicrobium sp. AB352]|uniref:AMIN-like domain-containing (lipo)protein n=1 Tax=Cellulosimicrobium sp. AB352 TaxID=3413281 RepID=UPI003C254E33